ncbi:MAG: hypothetical protein M3395_07980 [Chloroflexota bacterium]|nr:hypothetical protein [Chloroflexota bacterium]
MMAVVAVLAIAGCGGTQSNGGGGGGGGGGEGEATFASRVTVTSADERVPYGLQEGRYRLNWEAECRPTITLTPAEGGEPVYSTTPSINFVLVNSLEAGLYFVDLEGEDCGEWEISLAAL